MKPSDTEIKKFLASGLEFEAGIQRRGADNRKGSLDSLTNHHLESRQILMSTFGYLVNAKLGIPGLTSDSIHERLLLLSQFIQGAHITEICIREGYYAKAAAVLKQEFETLTRVSALRQALKVRHGKLVNIQSVHRYGQGAIYGELNDIAHISKPDILAGIIENWSSGKAFGVSP
ncbi:hypothetical protein ACFOPQ_05290 [Deinococcus antarcticus]|uniref:Uncharacterized protein n=1 Tax=Deinococcus antarcticus TaxID=1298767 RepID=A0ABV8A3C6_9DEIO